MDRLPWVCRAWHASPVDDNQTPVAFQALVFLPSLPDPGLAADTWTLAVSATGPVRTDRLEAVHMASLCGRSADKCEPPLLTHVTW